MTNQVILFNEIPANMTKKQIAKKQPKIQVNPDHVGAILPRSKYTTLVIQGKYFHVAHTHEEVLGALGFTSRIRAVR